jgi:hypothetical protein
LAPAAIAKLI